MSIMKGKSRGFTLIELIVVIAIMVAFTGGSFAAFGLVQSGNVKNVTKTIASGLSELRMKTMTQNLANGWELRIYKGSDDIYYMDMIKGVPEGETPIITTTALKKADITYTGAEGEEYSVDELLVTYNASTGAIASVVYHVTGGAAMVQTTGTGTLKAAIGNKESTVELYFATGKYETK